MTLTAGSRFGPYEILSPLGAGGMGEVYRAKDSKLGREVAIKILPSEFSRDGDRLARFEREARVLAALNHPGIAAIYGLEQSNGTRFLVLELVEGETLSEKLAGGPLPTDEALGVGRQICEALEAAHDKGIVHRDLKPANVKITPAGKVKVLDFGLAKAFGAEPAPGRDLSRSPTLTSGGTQKGVILGTAAYMSPEQARGRLVDRRTDVWSFGCVLYEMLTGRKAFEGETVSDIMASVLTREPDWGTIPVATPSRVRDLLRRCLQKDPERRLHDIADVRLEIEEAAHPVTDTTSAAGIAAPPRRGLRLLALAAAALAGAALAWLLASSQSPRPAAVKGPSSTKLARLTQGIDRSDSPTWSPDGNLLAYSSNAGGNFDIYVRRGQGGQDVNVTNDLAQDVQPAFSPDGNSIAFVSTRSSKTGLIKIGGTLARNTRTYGGDLWVVPALGGAARRLAADANYPAWRPDGSGILYVSGPESRRSIFEVSPAGGAPRAVLPSEASVWEFNWLACSPDGRWVSLETQLEGVLLMPAAGGKPHVLLEEGSFHAWDASSGRLYFMTRDPQGGGRIQSVAVNLRSGAVEGAPRTISLMTANLRDLAVSRDGLRLAFAEDEATRHLTRLPLSPDGGAPAGPEEPLSNGRVTDSYPNVSPDGRQIAYISDILGHNEVWILDLDTRHRRRLQLPGEDIAQVSPVWWPDGRRLSIGRWIPGSIGSNWIVAVDGSQAEEISRGRQQSGWVVCPSPDGKRLALTENGELLLFDLDSRKKTRLTDAPGDKFDAIWSRDGRWIAYTGIGGGALQLFRISSSGGEAKQLTTGHERMRHAFFSPDGRWIYIQPSHRNIYRVRAEGGPLEPVTRFPEGGLFLEEPTLTPDGRHLVYCRGNELSSLWLLTLEERSEPSADSPKP